MDRRSKLRLQLLFCKQDGISFILAIQIVLFRVLCVLAQVNAVLKHKLTKMMT